MSKKTSKSGYRTPTRSEKILAVIGIIVILSMVLSSLALGDNVPVVPTSPPSTIMVITVAPTTEPTAAPTSSGPATATPGQAPAPGSP